MIRAATAVLADRRYWPAVCNVIAAAIAAVYAVRAQQSVTTVQEDYVVFSVLPRIVFFLATLAAVLTLGAAVGYALLARTRLEEANAFTAVGIVGAAAVAVGAVLVTSSLQRWGMFLLVVGLFTSPLGAVLAYEELQEDGETAG